MGIVFIMYVCGLLTCVVFDCHCLIWVLVWVVLLLSGLVLIRCLVFVVYFGLLLVALSNLRVLVAFVLLLVCCFVGLFGDVRFGGYVGCLFGVTVAAKCNVLVCALWLGF